MQDYVIHPDTHSKLIKATDGFFHFDDGSSLPVSNGTPILFGKDSMFSADDIFQSKTTTQNRKHTNTSSFKNYVRRRLLPSLNKDFNIENRYTEVSKMLDENSKMLVLGVGEKSDYYRSMFPNCEVITSDVHNQFNPDYIFDGHFIPFENDSFDIVLAAQVIEHTINPWQFCAEIQRVTKTGGIIQIEAPNNFPYHAEPYDFFRFTYTGLRSLFRKCEVLKTEITEGSAALVAVAISNYVVNLSSKRMVRSVLLLITRLLFGWLKYLDKIRSQLSKTAVSMPVGYAFTFKKDNKSRSSKEMLDVFYNLKK